MHQLRQETGDPILELIDEHKKFMSALAQLESELEPATDGILSNKSFAVVQSAWREVNEHLNVHFVKEEEVFFPFIESMFPYARVKFQFLHVDHDRLRECF